MPVSDVCIVGAGPAGSVLAARLAQAGLTVTLLEAGPRWSLAERAALVPLYLRGRNPWEVRGPGWHGYTNAGETSYKLGENRAQGVGGGTLHWEGYTPRLAPEDFRLRSRHGVGEDWPFGYDELEPFYVRAEAELGVAGAADGGAPPRSAPYPLEPFPHSYADRFYAAACGQLGIAFGHLPQARNSRPYGGRAACAACGTCFVCPTGAKATTDLTHVEAALATGRTTLLTGTVVQRLLARGRRVEGARARMREGEPVEPRAEVFVLAAGAVENARLLLLSRGEGHAEGLANSSGLVGRCLMMHPVVDVFGTVPRELFPYRTGFSTGASFHFASPPDRARVGSLLLEFMNNAGPQPAEVVLGSDRWGEHLEETIRDRFGRTAQVRFLVEQLPHPENAVELDADVADPAGSPVPRLRLALREHERRTMARAEEIGRGILQRMGAQDVGRRDSFAAHQAGTARMGADPHASVVDADLRAHDADNLYVLGSSAFPTAGAANPTLTIAALALRLGDHLVERLGARAA
ncbi:MAG: GMC family oxidoreductase [Gemmatimonadota bacterium]